MGQGCVPLSSPIAAWVTLEINSPIKPIRRVETPTLDLDGHAGAYIAPLEAELLQSKRHSAALNEGQERLLRTERMKKLSVPPREALLSFLVLRRDLRHHLNSLCYAAVYNGHLPAPTKPSYLACS